MQRTPPASIVSKSDSKSDSEPITKIHAPNDRDDSQSDQKASRLKRKRIVRDEDLKNSISEMKKKLELFESKQDQQFSSLENIVKELSQQITGLRTTIDFISKQYEGIKDKCEKLESERKDNLATIQSLEEKVENMERMQRSTSVELRNIPITLSESKNELTMVVANISKVVNAPISNSDIKDVFRTNTNSPNKPIIVDFNRVLVKENFLQCVKTYNKMHKDNKLNTKILRCDGALKPVFISENLTQKMRRLFYLSRDFAKTNNFKYCWTSHGKIYLRKNDGATLIRINSEPDINKLKQIN